MAEQIIVEMRKIYVSDLSIEVPHAPEIFKEQYEQGPEISLGLAKEITKLEEDNYHEVKLKLTVTAKKGDKTIYLVEVSQCAIMEIAGLEDNDLNNVLHIGVPTMLFPYASETITNAINRAGFPPLFLKPINFEALHQQELAQRQQASEAGNDTVQ